MRPLLVIMILMIMSSCGRIIFRSYKYSKAVKNQAIPAELLNSTWKVESIDGKPAPCQSSISLLEKGRLVINFGRPIETHYTYYTISGDSIRLNMGRLYKIAWTKDSCPADPGHLEFDIGFGSPFPIDIRNDRWEILSPIDKKTQLVLVRSHQ